MADSTQNFFPKLYGYTPDPKKEIDGNRLDKFNPYEFRKGMDYELTSMGCLRLAESTAEERQKATETVLKNLETHNGYYTSLITYESLYKNPAEGIKKPSFKSWLSEQDDAKMKPVSDEKMEKIKDAGHKNDKMEELKEAIKKEIRSVLSENKDEDFDADEDKADKAATKGAKKAKGNRFDLEKDAINDLLYRGKKGKDSEYTKEDPAPGSILAKKDELLQTYKTKFKGKEGGADQYNELLVKANEKFEKSLEKHIKTFGADGKGNNVTIGDVFGKTLPETIKALGARLKAIEKEEEEDIAKTNEMRYEIAKTDMTREQHIKLLEIIRENGISLREGAMGVKTYYEIAKAAYLEGLSNGLKL